MLNYATRFAHVFLNDCILVLFVFSIILFRWIEEVSLECPFHSSVCKIREHESENHTKEKDNRGLDPHLVAFVFPRIVLQSGTRNTLVNVRETLRSWTHTCHCIFTFLFQNFPHTRVIVLMYCDIISNWILCD